MKKIIHLFISILLGISFSNAQSDTPNPELLHDIYPGKMFNILWNQGSPSTYTKSGDRIYFWASDGVSTFGNLYSTKGVSGSLQDGTLDAWKTAIGVGLNMIPISFNKILVHRGANLHYSDGTDGGETLLFNDVNYDFTYPIGTENSLRFGNKAIFWLKRTNDTTGTELYITDGTTAGTDLFLETNPGTGNGFVGLAASKSMMQVSGNKAYFVAQDTAFIKVYKTNGTKSGTIVIDTIGNSVNFYPVVVNGKVFFSSNFDLYMIDTLTDVVSLADADFFGLNFYHMGNEIFYFGTGSVSNTRTLYAHNGSSRRIVLADQIPSKAGGISPLNYSSKQVEAGGVFFFFGHPTSPPLSPVQLWVSDGSTSGTTKVKDSIGVSGNGVDAIYACNNKVFYRQTGNVKIVWSINTDTYEMDTLIDYSGQNSFQLFLDEEICRFYLTWARDTLGAELYYLDFGSGPIVSGEIEHKLMTENKLILSPNPFSNYLKLSEEGSVVSFYSIKGEFVKDVEMIGDYIPTQSLKKGLYMAKVRRTNGEILVFKVLKE